MRDVTFGVAVCSMYSTERLWLCALVFGGSAGGEAQAEFLRY